MNPQTMLRIREPARIIQNDDAHPAHTHARQCVLNGHADAPLLTYAVSADGQHVQSVWAVSGQAVLLADE